MTQFKKGDFVKVGNDIGVVVGLSEEKEIPDEHLGIWYGEITDESIPSFRTVPEEFCFLIENTESYH